MKLQNKFFKIVKFIILAQTNEKKFVLRILLNLGNV